MIWTKSIENVLYAYLAKMAGPDFILLVCLCEEMEECFIYL